MEHVMELTQPTLVKRVNNDIWWFGDIDLDSAQALCLALKEAEMYCVTVAAQNGFYPEINLHINSDGGCIHAAVSVIDTMRSLSTNVNTHVRGIAASAASMISVFGHTRTIGRHSVMLIHQLRGGASGTHAQLQDFADNTSICMQMIEGMYRERTKLKPKLLQELLRSDKWLDANFCLQHGLVDSVV